MLDGLHVPVIAGAVLLVVAGGAKLRDPYPLHRALRASRLPTSPVAARVTGAIEFITGLASVTVTSRAPVAAMAVLYIAFAAFVIQAIARSLPLASCGCFGAHDTPPGPRHVAINAALGASAALAARSDLAPARELIAHGGAREWTAVAAGLALAAVLRALVSSGDSRSTRSHPARH